MFEQEYAQAKPAQVVCWLQSEASLQKFNCQSQFTAHGFLTRLHEVVVRGSTSGLVHFRDRDNSQLYSNRVKTIL